MICVCCARVRACVFVWYQPQQLASAFLNQKLGVGEIIRTTDEKLREAQRKDEKLREAQRKGKL